MGAFSLMCVQVQHMRYSDVVSDTNITCRGECFYVVAKSSNTSTQQCIVGEYFCLVSNQLVASIVVPGWGMGSTR